MAILILARPHFSVGGTAAQVIIGLQRTVYDEAIVGLATHVLRTENKWLVEVIFVGLMGVNRG